MLCGSALAFQNFYANAVLKIENRHYSKRAVVLARLIAPSSDLASWRWLKERTALLEFLPVDLSIVEKDQIYTIADELFAYKETLEKALRERENSLFKREATLFLYDLTNTYFVGQCLTNDLAKRGKSKEKRLDCPLVTLALVVDGDGFPIMSQIYQGNQSEPETLPEILEQLYLEDGANLFEDQKPTLVMDRGIATKDNLAFLKENHYPYIVVERRQVEKEYQEEFKKARETFQRLGDTNSTSKHGAVYVKKISFGTGCRVLCLSEGREQKERAIDASKEERFLGDLMRVKNSVNKGRIKRSEKVGERIGRLKERYPSIAQHYTINLSTEVDPKNEALELVTDVNWEKKPSRTERSSLTGCYVIETSHKDYSADEIWRLYTTLTQVESAFSSLKTDLGVRPVYHQLAERTKAHLFISVLAYHLLNSIEYQLKEKGDHRRWGTLREQLSTHQRSTVILTDEYDQIHHIRVSGQPEPLHKEIYRLLNINDPLKRKHQKLNSKN